VTPYALKGDLSSTGSPSPLHRIRFNPSEPFDGTPSKYKDFIRQLAIFLQGQGVVDEDQKILVALSLNLKVKLLAHCQTHTSTFIFISSFQLKFSRHDNSTLNLGFCIENARDSNSFTVFQFAQ
jgi:hypothetical protein